MNDITPSHKFKREKMIRWGIAAIQVILMAFFLGNMLNVTFLGATLDDSWIHYQYVRNLALYGEVSFNPGEWSTGTTSLLWDLLLVPGVWAGISPLHFSLILGALLYLLFGQLIYTVFKSYWENELNCILSMAIVLMTGNLTWYALSGMETVLYLVIGLLWIISFRRGKFMLAGFLAGAAMLTRIEGLLFLLLGIIISIKNFPLKSCVKPVLQQIVFAVFMMLPSFVLNYYVTGALFPNTLAGKKWLYGLEPEFINFSLDNTLRYCQSWLGTLYQSSWWPELIDRPASIQQIILNLLRGGTAAGRKPAYLLEPYPLWMQAGAFLVSAVLFIIILRGIYRTAYPAFKNLFKIQKTEAWELLIFWFFSQNLIYLLLMPVRGHGGRYQAVNFILFGLFIIAGTDGCVKVKNILNQILAKFLKPGILLIYLASIITWGSIYSYSVKHVNDVHRAAGEYLRDNVPPETVVAAFDVGAIKYIAELPIADIAGLTDSKALPYVLRGDIVPYMRDKGAQYLAMVEDFVPGKTVQEPFQCIYYDKLGIRGHIGKSFELIPMKRFEIPPEIWIETWNALKTHSPAIAIYEIRWLENPQPPTLAGQGKNLSPQQWLSNKFHLIVE